MKLSRYQACPWPPLSALHLFVALHMQAQGEDVTVARATRMFPNALPGKEVILEKVFDTGTQRLFLRSTYAGIQDARGWFALKQAESALERAKNGALQRGLLEKMESMDDWEAFQVVVSLRHPKGITYLNKFDHPIEDLKDSFPDLVNLTNELPDLDIFMVTNSGYKFSSSYDSNIEILDISAADVTAGGTYAVTVEPFAWRRTADARANCTYAALTWTFVPTTAR